ncbi:MAG: hypothetical protein H9W81_03330 [Enterococcus sp.]|nr:hypothetical protein [Enterococcus sp.]
MSSYDVALQAWGANRLSAEYGIPVSRIDRSSITVDMDFNEGMVCCEVPNNDCYCTQAISPSANVVINGRVLGGPGTGFVPRLLETRIDSLWFDFSEILREIVEAGDGVISL